MRLFVLILGLYSPAEHAPELPLFASSEEEFLKRSVYWLFDDFVWNPQKHNYRHLINGEADYTQDKEKWDSLMQSLLNQPVTFTLKGYHRKQVVAGEFGATQAFGWEDRGEITPDEQSVLLKFSLRAGLPA